jgi:uncharacterized membrane protein
VEGLRLGENKGFVVAIAIALIVIATTVAVYYVWFRGEPEGYSAISILDANEKAENYPELVIIGQNNTFNVWVKIENHMGKTLPFEVKVRITQQVTPDFPAPEEAQNIYAVTLDDGKNWNTTATATIDTVGDYMVVYELWTQSENTETLEFTGNACVLPVEAIDQT